MTDDAPIGLDLPDDERRLLASGLLQWTGPARPTSALARTAGFPDVEALVAGADRLFERIEAFAPLTPREWTQAQLLVEVVWASDLLGAADEWEAVGPFDDARTVVVLRRLQARLGCITSAALLRLPEA